MARGLNTGVRFSAGTWKYLFRPTRRAKRPGQPSPACYPKGTCSRSVVRHSGSARYKQNFFFCNYVHASYIVPNGHWGYLLPRLCTDSLSSTLSMAWFLPIRTSLCGVLLKGELSLFHGIKCKNTKESIRSSGA